ncbi:MAG: hypothetical protein OEV99_06035 [Nitrospira sp.]|nr:hypothetical protein [Nitrospira sp.]MDH4369388.1 hypothetical protein [Nitrospira sp.]MDH5499184.1 hypothetical protein [Nitrospira sp.]MDH5725796.1 hypothetical protein [Nitrospira sp.]
MSGNSMRWTRSKNGLIVVVMGIVLVGIDGCAGEAPKPASTMTQDQVREHADKAFDKLKQDEKNRTTGSGVAPY